MLPYLHSTTYQIFGLTLQTWGTFVALGFLLGTYVAWRRAKAKGLNPKAILDLAFWIFVAAFIGARLFHVFFYDPQHYLAYPWDAIDPRQPGFSMFGGLIGAFVAFYFYAKKHGLVFLSYADTLIWGLPLGCGIGRIGCFLIHDHPGTLTHFFLGVKYPDGSVRHDLGLYLSLVGFGTAGLFLLLNRKPRSPGFWLAAYLLIESVVRFSTDFLRVVDQRYFWLTPTQWVAVPMFVVAIWLMMRKAKRSPLLT